MLLEPIQFNNEKDIYSWLIKLQTENIIKPITSLELMR